MRSHLHLLVVIGAASSACGPRMEQLIARGVDRTVVARSAHPIASDPARVGYYAGLSASGGGYFWDDVLEYRVWVHPDGSDYYHAFASYERAAQFSAEEERAEPPLVLVRQREWIAEEKPKQYEVMKTERITEWRVEWLAGARRGPTSLAEFLAKGGREPRGGPPSEAPAGERR
jgi:putative acetyltransferase